MRAHKHQFDKNEYGFNITNGEKEYFCKICQRWIMTVKK